MFGLSELLTNIIAGVLLATSLAGGWSWVQLQQARAELAEARTGLYQAEAINSVQVQQISDCSAELGKLVQDIEIKETAIADAEAKAERVERERNWAWAENAELRQQAFTDCEEWARAPVCSAVVEQWRAEYEARTP